jgi:hypothetical protein
MENKAARCGFSDAGWRSGGKSKTISLKKGVGKMKKTFLTRVFVYSLCISFLLTANGFHSMIAEAGQNIPVGQMVSHGGVKFEVTKNSWEKVETPFPVFEGMKIRTEKGEAVLALSDRTRIEVDSDSCFYFCQRDQFILLQGKVNFRIQPDVQLKLVVGNLRISKPYPLQSAKGSTVALTKDQEFVGAISMHSKGSVTVKSVQGPLHVTNRNGSLLASLSPGESVTLPSVVTGFKPSTMMTQADPEGTEGATPEATSPQGTEGTAPQGTAAEGAAGAAPKEEGWLGLSTWTWVGIGAGVAAVAGIAIAAGGGGGGGGDHEAPACP